VKAGNSGPGISEFDAFREMPMIRSKPALTIAGFLLLKGLAVAEVDFRSQVQPLLSEHCFNCHGPDSASRKGGLRLDRRADALLPAESGSPAIVPGKPQASPLLIRTR
jgi:Planctomycete cytochrome C